ncbi:hypothetical protein PR202_ga31364 [Eleusine coracana subsp. coracana]|uniref:Uncharacterized protein n=1 Tax=Eleusine coracana subsp. coracana TaxID=191504 RepID=A0AAV5DS07_ELECO|nr:hypothetical protein QOZ80_1AG0018190 [Eleusine coracana subsp. coracana]GJN13031.1 hypothetical protein PR202_ga31364 [Eleusine coracana subsp. coracana]
MLTCTNGSHTTLMIKPPNLKKQSIMASPDDAPPATVVQMPPPQLNGTTPKQVTNDESTSMPTAASPNTMTDKVMSGAANLAQLLPTGTVLAYQALSATFTNHGDCYPANRWLTALLVLVLSASCIFFSFTDSILGRNGKLYYGVATPQGFNVFNFSSEEADRDWTLGELHKLRLRPMDYVHAFFTVVVFLTVAFSDVGFQKCFFPHVGNNASELLTNLPLGMAFLSSFVFMMFPTTRKGIGFNDTTPYKKAS